MHMDDPHDDISMLLIGYRDVPLATQRVALALAELLIADRHGDEELEHQRPLTIVEASDRWLIESHGDYRPMAPPFVQSLDGPFEIEILKRNCRVIKFNRYGAIRDAE
jgi:hypothetical protein